MQNRHRLRNNQHPKTILTSLLVRPQKGMTKQYPTTKTDPFQNSSYRKRNNKYPSSTKFAIKGVGILFMSLTIILELKR